MMYRTFQIENHKSKIENSLMMFRFGVPLFAPVFSGRQPHERDGQDRKHECLNERNEKFQPIKGKWQEQEQKRHNQQDYFARKDVAEKTEGERNNLADFTDKFDNSYEHVNQTERNVAL